MTPIEEHPILVEHELRILATLLHAERDRSDCVDALKRLSLDSFTSKDRQDQFEALFLSARRRQTPPLAEIARLPPSDDIRNDVDALVVTTCLRRVISTLPELEQAARGWLHDPCAGDLAQVVALSERLRGWFELAHVGRRGSARTIRGVDGKTR